MGYQRYDRRKAHIRELDERAEALLAQQGAAAESEGAGAGCCSRCPCCLLGCCPPQTAQRVRAPCLPASPHPAGEEEGGPQALVMRELLKEEAPFTMLLQARWDAQLLCLLAPLCPACSARLVRSCLPAFPAPQTGQVLLGERQFQEARELLQAALDVCGKR